MMSPLTANIKSLSNVFNNADVAPDYIKERAALFESDVYGDIYVQDDSKNVYYLSEGYLYWSDHGRDKCSSVQCLNTQMDVPNNCGYHSQFYVPVHYKPICRGAYCDCLRSYPDY